MGVENHKTFGLGGSNITRPTFKALKEAKCYPLKQGGGGSRENTRTSFRPWRGGGGEDGRDKRDHEQ